MREFLSVFASKKPNSRDTLGFATGRTKSASRAHVGLPLSQSKRQPQVSKNLIPVFSRLPLNDSRPVLTGSQSAHAS